MQKEPTNKSITSSSVVGNSQVSFNDHPQNSDRHQRTTPKVSIQTSLFDEKRESNKTITMKSSGQGIRSMGSDNNPPPSPLKKMIGALGKGVGAITKGIGSGMGAITKGIGSGMGAIGKGIGSGMGAIGKGVGTFTKGVGKGIGMVGKGLGLNEIDKKLIGLGNALGLGQLGRGLGMVSKGLRLDLLGKGLGAISKQGLRGLGTLSKGLGLDMLGKGLGGLGKMGLTQLGRMKDIGKVLDLKQLVKKMAFSGGNSAIMTENDKKIMVVKGHMKRADTIAAILALLCLILSYYENDDFYNEVVDSANPSIIIKPSNQSTPWGNAIRGSVMLISIAMMVCVYLHYHLRLKILKLRKLMLAEDNLYSAGLVPKLAFELFICSICCPPYFDYSFTGEVLSGSYTYSYDAIINVITIFKSYLVLRTYQHYSGWTNGKALPICRTFKCQPTATFAIKAELKMRPYIMLAILMIATILYLGLAMRTSYKPEDPMDSNNFDFSFLANDIWLIVITMTTVGFGEGYPATHLGRFIGVIACLIGLLLVSLMVVSLTISTEFTPQENKAFEILKRIYANDHAKDKAANVIKTLFKIKESLKDKDVTSRFVWTAKLKKHLHIFKNDVRISRSHVMPVDETVRYLKENFEYMFQEVKQEVKNLPDLDEKGKDLKQNQEKIKNGLEEILKMQSLIGEYLVYLNNERN